MLLGPQKQSVCTHTINQHTSDVTSSQCLRTFKTKLKTRLFSASFPSTADCKVNYGAIGIFHFKSYRSVRYFKQCRYGKRMEIETRCCHDENEREWECECLNERMRAAEVIAAQLCWPVAASSSRCQWAPQQQQQQQLQRVVSDSISHLSATLSHVHAAVHHTHDRQTQCHHVSGCQVVRLHQLLLLVARRRWRTTLAADERLVRVQCTWM